MYCKISTSFSCPCFAFFLCFYSFFWVTFVLVKSLLWPLSVLKRSLLKYRVTMDCPRPAGTFEALFLMLITPELDSFLLLLVPHVHISRYLSQDFSPSILYPAFVKCFHISLTNIERWKENILEQGIFFSNFLVLLWSFERCVPNPSILMILVMKERERTFCTACVCQVIPLSSTHLSSILWGKQACFTPFTIVFSIAPSNCFLKKQYVMFLKVFLDI